MIRSARAVEMTAGESVQFKIGFKNTGAETWTRSGKNFVSIYTHDPKYRSTPFAADGWISPTQPGRIVEDNVKPGQVGTVAFTLKAPLEAGAYHETFHLSAESLAWIPGGKFIVDITVKEKAPLLTAAGNEYKYASGYKAAMMLVSDRKVSLETGQAKDFRIGFKNVGKTSWTRTGDAPITLKAMRESQWHHFRHPSWQDNVVTTLPEGEVKPGQVALLSFTIAASRGESGTFAPRFLLMAGDQIIDGGDIEIPIEVRRGEVPSVVNPVSNTEFTRSGGRGPNIRVGLFQPSEPSVTVTAPGAYWLINGDHQQVRQLSGRTTMMFDAAARRYTVQNGDYVFHDNKHVHLAPVDPAATIFEIVSHENRPTWDPNVNFNKFRGQIELFYSRETGRLWVIEELPLEDYMRGLAETSNGSPMEYQKALVAAARTYALFVISIGGKHKSDHYDLDTTGNDQVYKGYASELVRPNVVRAVEETRGMVVTHGGEVVVTPYFSRSDGRTRSWSEVWYGSRPWLVSKPAQYDAGKTLWGHGVGMSASDAIGRADAGTSWTDILKYYYTGIEMRQLY